SADGRLGATEGQLRVFQPFFVELNLPVALTRNDEVAVPVVVYNYHRDGATRKKEPQTVKLTLAAGAWFTPLDGVEKTLTLRPDEIASTSFRIKVVKVGTHNLEVTARGAGDLQDAIRREIEVIPDG